MHEAAIAQSVLLEVQALLEQGQISGRVEKVYLRVGRLTAVVPENLRFMFEVLTRETALEGASLEIELVPLRGGCKGCGFRFQLDEPIFLCSRCASPEVEIESGTELLIDSVEVV